MGSVSKELFEKFAQTTQEELNQNNNSGSYSFEGEDIKWTSPDRGKKKSWKVYRLIGNPPATIIPNSNPQPEDPVEIMYAEVKDDNGKMMKLRLPVADGASNTQHLIHRIVARVMEKEYLEPKTPGGKKDKFFPVKANHPDIFEMVSKSGWAPTDNKYQFASDWGGKRVTIFNCIDRDMMDWHRANKHTALLAKNIGVSTLGDGSEVEWPATGVPSYGFVSKLLELVKTYNSKGKGNGWEGFDIGMYRTGTTEQPNIIYNVSAFKAKDFLDEIEGKIDINKISIADDLTDEEKSWERYDLQKLFAPTSYSKILKRMGKQIKRVDAALNTNYYDELKQYADKEAAEWKAKKEADVAAAVDNGPKTEVQSEILQEPIATPLTPEPPKTETPISEIPVRRTAAATNSEVDTSLLKGWEFLTDEEKSKIIRTEKDADGKLKNIVYAPDVGALSMCECGIPVPYIMSSCPACGCKFED